MQYLCQVRKNGNVVASTMVPDWMEWLKTLPAAISMFTLENLQSLSIGVTPLPDGASKPLQYQAITLYTIKADQADTEEQNPDLADLKEYIEQATHVTLDDAEHGNPYGFVNPLVLVDTLMPIQFDLPNVDPLQVCYYYRRRGYVPDAKAVYIDKGECTLVSYPYPTDDGIEVVVANADWGPIMVRANLNQITLVKTQG